MRLYEAGRDRLAGGHHHMRPRRHPSPHNLPRVYLRHSLWSPHVAGWRRNVVIMIARTRHPIKARCALQMLRLACIMFDGMCHL